MLQSPDGHNTIGSCYTTGRQFAVPKSSQLCSPEPQLLKRRSLCTEEGRQEGQRWQLRQQQHKQHNRCNAAAPARQHFNLKPLMSTHLLLTSQSIQQLSDLLWMSRKKWVIFLISSRRFLWMSHSTEVNPEVMRREGGQI